MSAKVLALVEGYTEEAFVHTLIAPHLAERSVFITPIILATRRRAGQPYAKGGSVSYARFKDHLRRLLQDTSAKCITTFIDFYGLGQDFPHYATMPQGTIYQRAEHLESAMRADVPDQRFLPYLALHEFEALLFSAPEAIAQALPDAPHDLSDRLWQIRRRVESPEEIDDQMPPSKHLSALYKPYDKRQHGILIAQHIGLAVMRQACLHFGAWLGRLEALTR